MPSLHRASTDALIAYCNVYPGVAKPGSGELQSILCVWA